MIELKLPWPVSTNKAWKPHGRNRFRLNPKVNVFRLAVKSIVVARKLTGLPLHGPLQIDVMLFPPDRRTRDGDNFDGKVLYDALTKAGVWCDDSQVRDRRQRWGEAVKGGCVVIKIAALGEMAA